MYQIANAQMREYPYAHIYVKDVFPEDFYAGLREHWPTDESLVCIGDSGRVAKGAYPERFILPVVPADIQKLDEKRRAFWLEFGGWLLSQRFMNAMIEKFEPYVRERFGDAMLNNYYGAESLVVRDLTNYSIGPHTDSPRRLLSMLFYCPDDDSRPHLGTSIYSPHDPEFRCDGGPHYPHRRFQKIKTMEYRRNSLFAFIKNNHSFHGVDPIGEQPVGRDVLLYDVRVEQAVAATDKPATAVSGLGAKILKRLISTRNS